MRAHYNNLQKIQAQDSKSNLQTVTRYSEKSEYPYNHFFKISYKPGILRAIMCVYVPST